MTSLRGSKRRPSLVSVSPSANQVRVIGGQRRLEGGTDLVVVLEEDVGLAEHLLQAHGEVPEVLAELRAEVLVTDDERLRLVLRAVRHQRHTHGLSAMNGVAVQHLHRQGEGSALGLLDDRGHGQIAEEPVVRLNIELVPLGSLELAVGPQEQDDQEQHHDHDAHVHGHLKKRVGHVVHTRRHHGQQDDEVRQRDEPDEEAKHHLAAELLVSHGVVRGDVREGVDGDGRVRHAHGSFLIERPFGLSSEGPTWGDCKGASQLSL